MATIYKTSDNREFDSEFEARNHQDGLDRANAKTWYKTDDGKSWGSESDGQAWNCALAANSYYEQEDWDGVLEMCNRGMAYNPHYGIMLSLYRFKGLAYMGKKDYDAAIDTFSTPLDKDPSNRMGWNNASLITDPDQRIAVVSLYVNRGSSYIRKGMKEEASADFKKGIDFCNVYRDEKNLAIYRNAAEQKLADLDSIFVTQGVTAYQAKDYAKAVELWKKAADMGNKDGQNNLGTCYATGKGVQKDLKKAVEWFKKAVANGHEDAKKFLAKAEAELAKL